MRIGIIATRWGLMYVGAFRACGADVVALAGKDFARTRDLERREGIPFATTDTAELCARVDIVVVASPDEAHARHVEQALDAGVHVLCEKPLTLDVEEATRLAGRSAAAPEQVTVTRVVGNIRNGFLPPGDLEGSSRRGGTGDFGGVSHVLDCALWLAGEAARTVQAKLVGTPLRDVTLHLERAPSGHVMLQHLASLAPCIDGQWRLSGEGWEAHWRAGCVPSL